jgi:hypothetical protein
LSPVVFEPDEAFKANQKNKAKKKNPNLIKGIPQKWIKRKVPLAKASTPLVVDAVAAQKLRNKIDRLTLRESNPTVDRKIRKLRKALHFVAPRSVSSILVHNRPKFVDKLQTGLKPVASNAPFPVFVRNRIKPSTYVDALRNPEQVLQKFNPNNMKMWLGRPVKANINRDDWFVDPWEVLRLNPENFHEVINHLIKTGQLKIIKTRRSKKKPNTPKQQVVEKNPGPPMEEEVEFFFESLSLLARIESNLQPSHDDMIPEPVVVFRESGISIIPRHIYNIAPLDFDLYLDQIRARVHLPDNEYFAAIDAIRHTDDVMNTSQNDENLETIEKNPGPPKKILANPKTREDRFPKKYSKIPKSQFLSQNAAAKSVLSYEECFNFPLHKSVLRLNAKRHFHNIDSSSYYKCICGQTHFGKNCPYFGHLKNINTALETFGKDLAFQQALHDFRSKRFFREKEIFCSPLIVLGSMKKVLDRIFKVTYYTRHEKYIFYRLQFTNDFTLPRQHYEPKLSFYDNAAAVITTNIINVFGVRIDLATNEEGSIYCHEVDYNPQFDSNKLYHATVEKCLKGDQKWLDMVNSNLFQMPFDKSEGKEVNLSNDIIDPVIHLKGPILKKQVDYSSSKSTSSSTSSYSSSKSSCDSFSDFDDSEDVANHFGDMAEYGAQKAADADLERRHGSLEQVEMNRLCLQKIKDLKVEKITPKTVPHAIVQPPKKPLTTDTCSMAEKTPCIPSSIVKEDDAFKFLFDKHEEETKTIINKSIVHKELISSTNINLDHYERIKEEFVKLEIDMPEVSDHESDKGDPQRKIDRKTMKGTMVIKGHKEIQDERRKFMATKKKIKKDYAISESSSDSFSATDSGGDHIINIDKPSISIEPDEFSYYNIPEYFAFERIFDLKKDSMKKHKYVLIDNFLVFICFLITTIIIDVSTELDSTIISFALFNIIRFIDYDKNGKVTTIPLQRLILCTCIMIFSTIVQALIWHLFSLIPHYFARIEKSIMFLLILTYVLKNLLFSYPLFFRPYFVDIRSNARTIRDIELRLGMNFNQLCEFLSLQVNLNKPVHTHVCLVYRDVETFECTDDRRSALHAVGKPTKFKTKTFSMQTTDTYITPDISSKILGMIKYHDSWPSFFGFGWFYSILYNYDHIEYFHKSQSTPCLVSKALFSESSGVRTINKHEELPILKTKLIMSFKLGSTVNISEDLNDARSHVYSYSLEYAVHVLTSHYHEDRLRIFRLVDHQENCIYTDIDQVKSVSLRFLKLIQISILNLFLLLQFLVVVNLFVSVLAAILSALQFLLLILDIRKLFSEDAASESDPSCLNQILDSWLNYRNITIISCANTLMIVSLILMMIFR